MRNHEERKRVIIQGVTPEIHGGILIDAKYQRQGYGRKAIQAAITMLAEEGGYQQFALSYAPHNSAKRLYHSLGFIETDEWEDDEVVARLSL